jgi:hypothetical protein
MAVSLGMRSELTELRKPLTGAGGDTTVVSPKHAGGICGWNRDVWGGVVEVDVNVLWISKSANENEYDALLLPGGVMSPARYAGTQVRSPRGARVGVHASSCELMWKGERQTGRRAARSPPQSPFEAPGQGADAAPRAPAAWRRGGAPPKIDAS